MVWSLAVLAGRGAGSQGWELHGNLGKGTVLRERQWGFTKKKKIIFAFCHMTGNYSHKDRFQKGWILDNP